MKTFYITCLLLAMCAGVGFTAGTPKGWSNALRPKGKPGPALTLATNGKAGYVILLPSAATTQEEKAAEDLARWLKEMTRADFPVLHEGRYYKSTLPRISIGHTQILRSADLPEARLDLADEGYAIAVKGDDIYLVGGKSRGIINAVYALLEEDLGCRWYAVDQARGVEANMIPRANVLTFRPVPRHFVPTLEMRDPYYWNAWDGNWSLRNRTNSDKAVVPEKWGGRFTYALFVHTYNDLVPPGQYFDEHPEYYSEVDGKRQPIQLCLTNPEVLRITIENVKKFLRENPGSNVISVSPNDGYGYCECAKCKAVDDAEGTKAGTLLQFVNAVADVIAPEFPGVKVSTLAYLGTFMPPKTIKPRPNVAIQICTDSHAWPYPFFLITETDKFQKAMKAWEAIGATMHVWDYTVNYQFYMLPMPNMQVVTSSIRFFVEHNASGVLLQGNVEDRGSARGDMRCWVWAKLLWDPSRDTHALIRDFVYGYYGEASEPIWEYNEMLWNMWEENSKKPRAPETPLAVNPFMTSMRVDPDNPMYSEQFLNRATDCMDRAERLAKDPEIMRRVKMAKLPIVFTKLCQGIGFEPANVGGYRPGKIFKSEGAGMIGSYERLLDEFEQIVSSNHITRTGESIHVDKIIANWRERLNAARAGERSEP